MKHKVGIMTGGGDCAGLNAAIRAFVLALGGDYEVYGFHGSWNGLINDDYTLLTPGAVDAWLPKGGTELRSAKIYPLRDAQTGQVIKRTYAAHGLEALVVIGGDDTLSISYALGEKVGMSVLGIPKTIDNDIFGTDFSIGFWTAVTSIMEAGDRLQTTAASHARAIVMEVMGRHAGWLAAYGGIAVGADVIFTPEDPRKTSEWLNILERKRAEGKKHALVVVAEGASLIDDDGKEIKVFEQDKKDPRAHVRYGGIGKRVAEMIDARYAWDTRVIQLGHVQRGGSPSAVDRVLASFLGGHAAQLVKEEKYGFSVCLQAGKIVHIPMKDLAQKQQLLSSEALQLIRRWS